MIDVDFRCRRETDIREVDFAAFFEEELPGTLAGERGALAARGARRLGVGALGFQVDGRVFTLAPEDEALAVYAGDAKAAAVVRLDARCFSEFVQDLCSTMGLLIAGEVEMVRGGNDDFLEWEPVMRALLDGRPVYEPGSVLFADRDGGPLPLPQSFTPDDDDAEMAHFLGQAGFLHIAGVFTPAEMAEISADIDRALPSYAPDDGRSWWAHTRSGEHRAVRLQYFDEHSERTAALLRDPRFLRIGALTCNDHRSRVGRGENACEALVKPLGVVKGISDVPWHKDCSLGRHSYRCCSLTVGICVTDADRESGELGVVAGSHRASVPPVGVHRQLDLPRIPLPCRAGDVTVHLSCTLHMSRPPTGRERRVLYTGFGLPLREGEHAVGEERVRAIRESAPTRMGQESDTLRRVRTYDLDS